MRTIKRFLFRLYNGLKVYMKSYTVIHNANGSDESNYHKRALLIYVVQPFLLEGGSPKLLRHQNSKQCRQIATVLDELGYIVDAVDVRDRRE
ncbi:MAG: hypothetical protein ACREOW_18595 [Thermodesulfobacteriota bacterium]